MTALRLEGVDGDGEAVPVDTDDGHEQCRASGLARGEARDAPIQPLRGGTAGGAQHPLEPGPVEHLEMGRGLEPAGDEVAEAVQRGPPTPVLRVGDGHAERARGSTRSRGEQPPEAVEQGAEDDARDHEGQEAGPTLPALQAIERGHQRRAVGGALRRILGAGGTDQGPERQGGALDLRRRPGHPPGEEPAGQDTPCVDVGAGVGRVAAPLLRSDVGWGAGDDAHRARHLGETQVEDLHVPVGLDEDVVGLQVPVDDTRGVHLGEPHRHGSEDAPGLLPGERPLLEPVGERLALEELVDEVGAPIPLADVVQRDDGGVVDLRSRFPLPLDPLQGPGGAIPLRAQDLDGHPATQVRVLRLEDEAEAATPDLPHQEEAADAIADLRGGRQVGPRGHEQLLE